MCVDLKLEVSTESFITDEQLFSPGAFKTNPTKNIISTIKSKNNVAVIGESDVKVFGKMSNDDLLFLT
jgi:hypothetical protein